MSDESGGARCAFRAEGVNVPTKRRGSGDKKMNDIEPISEEELRELQKRSQPDDSVSVPPNEGMTPQEAAKIIEIYDRRIAKGEKIDKVEQSKYQAAQQIADKGGVLPSDLKPSDGPFKNDADMMK
jgi:hypothetical protein